MTTLMPLLLSPFIGSFISTIVVRWPEGEQFVFGRSACPECHHHLGVLDLIPLVSWMASRRNCRYCRKTISALYPAIEVSAMAIAIIAVLTMPTSLVLATCVLGWFLLAIAAIDIRSQSIPNILTYPLMTIGLSLAAFSDTLDLSNALIGLAAGFTSFTVISWVYKRLRGRPGLGMGDAKLMATAGAWLGWAGLPSVVLISALSGLAVVGVHRMMMRDRSHVGQRIPYGPFLSIGILTVWLIGPLQFGG